MLDELYDRIDREIPLDEGFVGRLDSLNTALRPTLLAVQRAMTVDALHHV